MTDAATEHAGPYFFLSHAHPIEQLPGEATAAQDPDYWVRKVCEDLSRAVAAHAPAGTGPRGLFHPCQGATAPLNARTLPAVTTAGSFLALYSDSYPGDDWVRVQRITFADHVPDAERRIVPVLWEHSTTLDPAAVEAALIVVPKVPDYAKYGLLSLSRRTDAATSGAYRGALAALSEWIAGLVDGRPAARQLPPEWQPLHPRPTGTFLVAVLAPTWTEMLGSSAWYGSTATEWSPFTPEHPEPLVQQVAALVNPDVYVPRFVDCSAAEPPVEECPGVLLIDPWIARDPPGQRRLADVLRVIPQWMVPALVACGDKWQAGQHREALALAEVSVRNPAYSPPGRHPPAVLHRTDDFDPFFRDVLREARRRFATRRPVKLPAKRFAARPRIVSTSEANE